ncbi:MAG: type VI secretion system baseplate subunit TssG [Rhodospirillaceae bacterium]|nr:type VI secretion system baseplate subunit TssG [Rhodospirillaceae bacterium]
MVTARRRTRTPVTERLLEEPHAFEFFQAVQVLERAARRATDSAGGGRVGEDVDPQHEAVRFVVSQALAFPSGEVLDAKPPTQAENGIPGRPPELGVAFLGLTGPSGVLPQHYTELLIKNVRDKNFALRDFFDLFNHRLISLFHRAWEKYRLPASYERHAPEEDPLTSCLMALVGVDTPHLRNRMSVDDEAIIHFSGHYAHWPRSAASLEAILSDFFERPVRIQQFRGRWTWLAPDEFTALPTRLVPEGAFAQLGMNAVVGERVWDVQGTFRIRIGPVNYRQFISFMPGSKDLAQLVDLTRLFVGPTFSFDMQLTLAKEEVPFLVLAPEGDHAPRLGWNTWLKHAEFHQDASDAVFLLDHV